MPDSLAGTMNSSMPILGGSAATAANQKPPAASAASECRMNFIFSPLGWWSRNSAPFYAGRDALRRLRHAHESALNERPERLVGLADAFGERHVSVVSQLG